MKAILDVTNGYAYIQNADTNGYLESTLKTLAKASDVAPAGFGLGTDAVNITNANNAIKNGWYRVVDVNTTSANVPHPTGLIFVQAYSSSRVVQDFYYFASYTAHYRRSLGSNGWSAWRNVIPTMYPDHTYQTTKLWGGHVVYVKRIEFGALPACPPSVPYHFKALDCGVDDSQVISLTGFAWKKGDWNPLPGGFTGEMSAYAWVSGTSLGVTTSKDLSEYTATFILEYTKTSWR